MIKPPWAVVFTFYVQKRPFLDLEYDREPHELLLCSLSFCS
jgi:hypothetical protein